MNKSDLTRNQYQLKGKLSKEGYDWWWHNFTGVHSVTGEIKAFYIEYFLINPELNPAEVVLGQESPEQKPSYFMMNVGTWGKNKKQLHNFYPIEDVKISNDLLRLEVDQNLLTESYIEGNCQVTEEEAQNQALMSDAGAMTWKLKVDKQITYNVGYGAGPLFRKLNAFEMYWHAEGIKTLYEGQVTIDGETYDVKPESCYGYADKNWGKDFTSPWLWISSCHLRSKMTGKILDKSAIEIGGGQPKIFGFPIEHKILMGLYYEGEMIEFNFSKFWHRSQVTFKFQETETQAIWYVKAKNRKYEVYLKLTCELEDMLEINYEAPNGLKEHNHLLNGGTGKGILKIYNHNHQLLDVIEVHSAGCEYGEKDM